VIDLISELVDKSMVIANRQDTTIRYRLLETLRQYGEERLNDRSETAALRDLHLAHYREIAAGVETVFNSPRQLEADDLVDVEWDNFRAGHEWAITTGDFAQARSIVAGLFSCTISELRHETREWVASTIKLGATLGREDGYLYAQASFWALNNGHMEQTLDFAERGAAIAGDDEQAIAATHAGRVVGLVGCGRIDEGVALIPGTLDLISATKLPRAKFWLWIVVLDAQQSVGYNEAYVTEFLAVCDEIGAPAALADGQRLVKRPPDIDGAIEAIRNAIAIADESRSKRGGSWARFSLAVAMMTGNRNGAVEALTDSIVRANDARAILTVTLSIEIEATYLVALSRLEPAAVILGHLETKPVGFGALPQMRERNLAAVANLDNLASLKARGAAMSRQEIVDFALAQLDQP